MADEEKPAIIYDTLDLDELRRDHAQFSYIRSRLHRASGMMSDDMASSISGREIVKLEQLVEKEMTLMQGAIRRLETPDE